MLVVLKMLKSNPLVSWLEAMDPTVLCINETWLNSNVSTSEVVDDKKFTVFRNDRKKGRGRCLISYQTTPAANPACSLRM
jgi:hypothetical protein